MNGALYEETQGFAGWVYALLVALLVVLLAVVLLRLQTVVTSDAVTIRYGFLYRARVPVGDIVSAEAIAYRPVRDYGGWGVRGFGRRRALNARGNLGVLLTRQDGRTLLIGSQRPRELLAALAHAGIPTRDSLPVVVRDF